MSGIKPGDAVVFKKDPLEITKFILENNKVSLVGNFMVDGLVYDPITDSQFCALSKDGKGCGCYPTSILKKAS